MKRPVLATTFFLLLGLQFSSSSIGAQEFGVGVFGGLPGQQQPPTQRSSISGSVVKGGTGEPIAGAQITITRVGAASGSGVFDTPPAPAARGGAAPTQAQQPTPADFQMPLMIPAVRTDGQGKFLLPDVPVGSYRISATRNGYAQQQFGQRAYGRPGTVVTVRAGQPVQDITFRLMPAATITGRVTDPNGEPLPGVTVQALRPTYDATGKRQLQPVVAAKTNDLGEYRLYWITPGRYFVNANAAPQGLEALFTLSSRAEAAQTPNSLEQAQQMAQSQAMMGPGRNPNEEDETGFVSTYYPNTPDASRAVSVELQSGAEVRGIDFLLARDRKVHIRGRILDATTGRAPSMAQVSVSSRDAASAVDFLGPLGGMLQGNTYDPSTGEFEVKEVSSGRYWLQVITQGAPLQPVAGARGAAPENPGVALLSNLPNTTQIPVDVYGYAIENLIVTVTPGVTIPGRIHLEGTPLNPNQSQNPFATFNVSLLPGAGGGPMTIAVLAGLGRPPAPDGTFSLQRVAPGDYKLAVRGLGPNMYIKEARLDQKDILAGVTIGEHINGTLEITLSANGGVVDGRIIDETLKPLSGIQTVLIPDTQRDRHDLYKTGITDPNGNITFRGLTPGDYRLFAWEDIEPFSYFDPDVLKQYEQHGKLVRVRESSREQVEMKVIASPAP